MPHYPLSSSFQKFKKAEVGGNMLLSVDKDYD